MSPGCPAPIRADRVDVGRPAWRAIGVALVVLLASSAHAQGLGDAAAREQSKRRTEQGEAKAKVFTNDDLAEGEPPAEQSAAAAGSDESATPEGTASPTDGRESEEEWRERTDRDRDKRALQEREWRARFTEARARVREEEARCWQDVVRTEFYQGIPVQMKVKEFVESEAYRQAKKDLADLQEQYRRTGLPPGWARE